MISFNSKYIENKVRKILGLTIFPGVGLKPVSDTQVIFQECLRDINCISIGCASSFWGIRDSKMHEFWQSEMSTPWNSFSWCSLDLDYDELITTDGWEDDLKLFSHIHTFYCAKQVPDELITIFKKLNNLELSDMDIRDWSILANFQHLYTVSLDNCGCEGNRAIEFLCDLYLSQIEEEKKLGNKDISAYLSFMGVVGMCVNDLSPFARIGKSLQLDELNLSNNAIGDVSPLFGASVDTLILSNNEIENIDGFEFINTYWININGNRLNAEDMRKVENSNRC